MTAHQNNIATSTLSGVESGVIRTLLYFDIFNYPLTAAEISIFFPQPENQNNIDAAIQNLVNQNLVFCFRNFYSLQNDDRLVERREAGNKLADKKLKTAKVFGRLISRFPFVRAVMLSGSISKNYMDKDSDIDYFVVTESGKLWLTRGLLALFKRVFLLNSHKFFCTNYFIDTTSLEIEEKNIYTAIEIATLIPLYGNDIYEQFLKKNTWIQRHLPNIQPQECMSMDGKSKTQNIGEKILIKPVGNWLNNLFYRTAIKRWNSKYRKFYRPEDFDIAFKSRVNVSKNHPNLFQKKTLENYSIKIKQFENRNRLNLSI